MNQKSLGIRITPFAIGIICFLLPFLEISCGGIKQSVTGLQLVTGIEGESPNPYAIISLVAVIAGLLFSIKSEKAMSILAGIMGTVSIIAIILLKVGIDTKLSEEPLMSSNLIEYKIGYWGLCIASGIGAFLSFLRVKEASD